MANFLLSSSDNRKTVSFVGYSVVGRGYLMAAFKILLSDLQPQ
jgi:hypothetical protein